MPLMNSFSAFSTTIKMTEALFNDVTATFSTYSNNVLFD